MKQFDMIMLQGWIQTEATLTHALDRNAPYVGIDVRVLPAPYVENVKRQVPRKERCDRDQPTEQMERRHAPEHTEQETEEIVGCPPAGSGVVRSAALVLLGELVQHVQSHEGVDAERPHVQERRCQTPHVEGTFDRAKVINQHVRADDAKVPGQRESSGTTEPVAGDEWEGVEPVGYARGVVHPGGLVGGRHDVIGTGVQAIQGKGGRCAIARSSWQQNDSKGKSRRKRGSQGSISIT